MQKNPNFFFMQYIKAILPSLHLPPGLTPSAPARHTLPHGYRAGIHYPPLDL